MMNSLFTVLISCLSLVFAQELSSATTNNPTVTESITSVATNGFNDKDMNTSDQQESWLKQHDRYVFIIVLVLLVLGVIIWYIVRSIRNMRRKLASENQGHMMMVQETIDTNGFQKMTDYPQQPQQQSQQQPYEHRY
jgi:flagellar biosynthesis/type III secretory pathway M-ring protein FliF/YscJ